MDSPDAPAASAAGVGVRVLLPDGGQMEPPEEEGEGDGGDGGGDDATEAVEEVDEGEAEGEGAEEGEATADEETSRDEAESGPDEGDEPEEMAEDDETDEEAVEGDEEAESSEREEAVADEGARLLHLNVDGVFLDLLGLELDLDTVTLDLTAVEGESKLLGNLLSAVAGLLDGNPLSSLLPDDLLGGMLPDLDPMERARDLAASVADGVRGEVDDAGSSILSALPLEELLAEFLQALVDQLLEAAEGDGESQEAEAAA